MHNSFNLAYLHPQRRKYKRYRKPPSTYLALIANVIQGSPYKRLTFCQIMDKLQTVISGDRKGLANNIRVCLSSSDCFVKVPVNPGNPNAQRNFWRIDESRITPQKLRRHFKGMEHIFPDLVSRSSQETETDGKNCVAPPTPRCAEQKRPAVKFTSPFSIESLLKKDMSHSTSEVRSISHESSQKVDQELLDTKGGDATKRECCSDTRAYDMWGPQHVYCMYCARKNAHVTEHGYDAVFSESRTTDDMTMSRKRICFSADVPVAFSPAANIAFQFNDTAMTKADHLVKTRSYYPHHFRF